LPAVVHSFTDTIKNQTQRNNSSGEKANLKLNRGLLGLALAFVIVFSVASLVQKQKDVDAAFQVSAHTDLTEKLNVRAMYCSLDYPLPHYNILVFPMAGNVEIAVTEKALHPDNSTRTQIYSFISANPGVQWHMQRAWVIHRRSPVSPCSTAEKRLNNQFLQRKIQAIFRSRQIHKKRNGNYRNITVEHC
jgi:hypothetical protein